MLAGLWMPLTPLNLIPTNMLISFLIMLGLYAYAWRLPLLISHLLTCKGAFFLANWLLSTFVWPLVDMFYFCRYIYICSLCSSYLASDHVCNGLSIFDICHTYMAMLVMLIFVYIHAAKFYIISHSSTGLIWQPIINSVCFVV